MFTLIWEPEATANYEELRTRADAQAVFRQVVKALRFLAQNPKHPGLHTHEYETIENPYDENAKVFEAYAQNNTPGAYRIFWCYGRHRNEITIIAITPHP